MNWNVVGSKFWALLASAANNVAWLSLAISVAAVMLSSFSLFLQYLKPFGLAGTAGAISIMPDHPGGASKSAFLYVPVLLRNTGSRFGTVSDLVVRVEHRGSRAVCEPVGLFDYTAWLAAGLQKKSVAESLTGLFVPPIIGGRESQLLHLIFTCDEMLKILKWLSEGGVSFHLLARIEGKENYAKLVERVEDGAHVNIIAEVAGGQAISMLDPSNNGARKKILVSGDE